MNSRRLTLPTSPEPDAEFIPFVFLRQGQPYKVAKRTGTMPWLHTWHESGQWCMLRVLPFESDITELRPLAIPAEQAQWYEHEQRRRHPHYYNPDGSLKR